MAGRGKTVEGRQHTPHTRGVQAGWKEGGGGGGHGAPQKAGGGGGGEGGGREKVNSLYPAPPPPPSIHPFEQNNLEIDSELKGT